MAEAIRFEIPELFLDYVAWAKVVLFSLGIKTSDLEANLFSMLEAVQKIVPSTESLVRNLIETAILKLPEMPTNPESFMNVNAPYGEIARNWMDAMLSQDRLRARALIFGAIDRGIKLTDIYDHVLVPCLRETGRLWQTRVINEAQEHFCAETVNHLLSLLSAQSDFDVAKNKRLAVGFCVANEQHSLGLRLALDCFQLLGWDTVLLGANVPLRNMDWLLQKWKPDVIAISVTMIYHLSDAQKAIAALRAVAMPGKQKIIVGGRPFILCPGLWEKVGADMAVTSCQSAMEIAQSLKSERREGELVDT
ncbi:MAG: cobalamin-dependent protein [Verrucomicrobiota bacterium]